MKPLCLDTLSPEDRVYLGNMSAHPGYQVLKKLISDACKQATEAVIKLDPADDQYDRKLKALQFTARAVNDFSSTLLKSVEMHSLMAAAEDAKKEEGGSEEQTITVGNPLKRRLANKQ